MFNGRGFTGGRRTRDNADGMAALAEFAKSLRDGLVFANLVDFDTLYGHRNDTAGFHNALREFDTWLGPFIERIRDDDYLVITADHGLDPTTPGTDHTREYVPLVFYHRKMNPRDLGVREGFIDVGATIADVFGLERFGRGKSLMML